MKTSLEVEQQVVERLQKAESCRAIGLALGMKPETVARIARDHGIEPRKNKLAPDVESEVVRRYVGGEPASHLARIYSVDQITIRNIVRRAGETIRSPGNSYRQFTAGQETVMVERYKTGDAVQRIADDLGVNNLLVKRHLRRMGIEPQRRISAGSRHRNWKGGRIQQESGYIAVSVPDDSPFVGMSNSQGYVMEHRLVMAQYLNRPLTLNETVHHINGDKQDNRLENLQLRVGRHGAHQAYCCADCGSRNIYPCALDEQEVDN